MSTTESVLLSALIEAAATTPPNPAPVVRATDPSATSPAEQAENFLAGLRANFPNVYRSLGPLDVLKLCMVSDFTNRDSLAQKLQEASERITALEHERTKSLADAFQGPWLPRSTYRRGALVQHQGSAWLALEDASGKPGESSEWKLLVKAGRDGR